MAGQFRDEDWQQEDEALHRLARSLDGPQGRSLWVVNHPTRFVFVIAGIVSVLLGAGLITTGASLATWLGGMLCGLLAGVAVGVPFARRKIRRHYPGNSSCATTGDISSGSS
jgi:hypothetical protein